MKCKLRYITPPSTSNSIPTIYPLNINITLTENILIKIILTIIPMVLKLFIPITT